IRLARRARTVMAKNDSRTLIEALRAGDLADVKVLVRRDPEAARSPQVTVEAGRLGWMKALELLIKNGSEPNAAWRGYRALHALIQEAPHKGHDPVTASRVECLKWLLAHGADPEQLGGWPASRAIITAAFVGQPAYIAELRKAGAVIDEFVSAALGDIRRVEKVLAKDPAFAMARDPGGLTALHCCAGSRLGASNKKFKDSLLAIARLLLDHGADLKARVRSWSHDVDTVYFAVSSSQLELFEFLLERGADATTALPATLWRDGFEFAELALRHGANIDRALDDGKPILNQMIRWGRIDQALWLLRRGASPNLADAKGWTAVHQAASRGNEKMMKAVLLFGGDSGLKDKEGNTPLDVARAKRHPKLVAILTG
ncbi:MAG TPA: ankyrin repeat domain-containing protein, partial [Blastocatellia bacterium]|nr:ankyrin repeat domain-containing protein [Blastocatellia bacterium]